MKKSVAVALLSALAACAAPVARPTGVTPPPVSYTTVGLERVLGQNAAGLTDLFGAPDADVREGPARKLQFGSAICVLDAYLYPQGSAEPRVTYLDAREPDGSAIDRASCVAALTRRKAAR
jgi:hypothetical protein